MAVIAKHKPLVILISAFIVLIGIGIAVS